MLIKRLVNFFASTALLLASAFSLAQGVPSSTPPDPILVGTTQSLSGRFQEEGREQLEGLSMWVDDINSRGQLLGRPVKLIYYDDHSAAVEVTKLYERLIVEDQVDLLIGPYGSELTLAATDVAERYDRPILTAAASAEKIWSRGYRNVFGIDVPASNYMDIAVQEAAARGARTAGLFYATGEFAEDVARGVRRKLQEYDVELVFEQQYTTNTEDFATLAQSLVAAEDQIDVLFGATYLADSVTIAKAMGAGKRLQVDMVALTVGPAILEFRTMLNNDVDGVVGVVQWLRSVRFPGAQDFAYRFRTMHGSNPGVHAAIGYSAGQVTEAAVRLANSTAPDRVREQLGTLRFRSLLGHYRVDETGRQIGKRNYLLQWQEGHRRLVAPAEIAERELIYPRP